MTIGWNLWVWLECIGVMWLVDVVVRRYIDIFIIIITFSYSTCISSFLAAASLFRCPIFKCFFVLAYVSFVQYIANVAQSPFEIIQKSR